MRYLLKRHGAIKYVLLALSGVLTCLPLIINELGFIQWVSMCLFGSVILAEAEEKTKWRTFYKYGFVYFMSFYLTSFHWFVALYPLSFIDGMSKGGAMVVVLFAWVGLSFLQTVFSAFVPVLIALLARRGLCKEKRLLLPVAAASVYVIFEWAQTLTWAGVPWARLAIGQVALPVVIKTASLLGSYLITFLIVAVNFAVAIALLYADKRRACAAFASALVAVNAVAGAVMIGVEQDGEDKVRVAALQLNISSMEKWSGDIAHIRDRLEKGVEKAALDGAEIIVTSETLFPVDVIKGGNTYLFLSDLAKRYGVTLVVGCFTKVEGGSQNSLLFVVPEGNVSETVYAKRHLVPFGEYVPLRSAMEVLVPPLAELSLFGEDLVEGEGSNLYDSVYGSIGSVICFDSIYEALVLETVRDGAELIVISTNDSWFLDSAGVRMHNAQARLRAVEVGRYIARSANTGVSSIIDPNGEILDYESALVEGYVIADVCPRQTRTLYSYVGNILVWASMAFFAVCIACCRDKKSKKNV